MDDFDFDFEMPDFDFEPESEEPETVEIVKPVEEMTESEVLSAFDALVNNDPDTIAAKAAIMEAEAIISDVEAQRKAKEEHYSALYARRQELMKELAEIDRELTSMQQFSRELTAKEREATRRKEAEEKKIEMVAEAIRVRYENQKRLSSYDEIAAKCAWFNGIQFEDGKLYKIFEQQYVGAKFLASAERCILADGMGTGKSLQSIAALDLAEAKKVLIIAQNDITTNFNDEVRRWSKGRVVTNIKGLTKERRNAMLEMLLNFSKEFTVIINFEAWRKDLALVERLISMGFDTVIIDEAHNIKDDGTSAYKGVKDICHRVNVCPKCEIILPAPIGPNGAIVKDMARICPKCAWSGESFEVEGANAATMTWKELEEYRFWKVRSVKRIWPMTGTPILNRPQDLYPMLHLIDPITFDSKRRFLDMYCEQDIYSGRWTFGYGGLERITRQLRGRYLARTMEDMGITIPEQRPIIHDLDLDKDIYAQQAEIISQITDSAEIVMNSGKSIPLIYQIQVMMRQRQANVWPGGIQWKYEDEDGVEHIFKVSEEIQESMKIDFAIQLIREAVDRGERLVLFSQFKTALDVLHSRLNGAQTEDGKYIRSVVFTGETDEFTRAAVKKNFDRKHGEVAKWDIVLAHYKVGGTGLNFTAATRTIVLDEEWNPGKRDQAYARTARIGQTETTFVDVIRINKTIDTWMAKLIDEKENMIGGFNDNSRDVQNSWIEAFKKGEFNG